MTIAIIEKYKEPHTTKNGSFKNYKERDIGTMEHNRFAEYTEEEIIYRCKQIIARNYPSKCIKIVRREDNYNDTVYYKTPDWNSKV